MAAILHRHAAVLGRNTPTCHSTPAQQQMAKYKIKTQIAARRSNYGDISATSKLLKLQLTKPNFTLHNRGDMCQILGKCTEQDTQ